MLVKSRDNQSNTQTDSQSQGHLLKPKKVQLNKGTSNQPNTHSQTNLLLKKVAEAGFRGPLLNSKMLDGHYVIDVGVIILFS